MNHEFLTWYVGDQIYGLELNRCKEVEKNLHLTPVPNARPYIAGIVNLRGDVVTVIDLRQLLRKQTIDRPERLQIIRLKSAGTQVAVIAEKIDDILSIPEEDLEPAGAHMEEQEAYYIQYVAITKKGPILILNSERLLTGRG
jgi:purine-binding chemotaxis protein CheW